MRESLAGDAYIERHVQALTRELKSPMSLEEWSGLALVDSGPDVQAAGGQRIIDFVRKLPRPTRSTL